MFKDKVVLITGASSGIGACTAIHFAKLGARLSLTGRNADNLNKVADECNELGEERPLTIVGDLVCEKTIENIIETTIKHYNKLDILVNNAGIAKFGTIESTSLEQYDEVFKVNVRSVYYLTQLAIPYLKQTKGNIVNVSSINGIRAFPNMLAYGVSKSALDQFTRCVALELASSQIRVNSVNPGSILTKIQERSGLSQEEIKARFESWKDWHPLGRGGEVDEVADAIVFLASENSGFITGVNLPVDGGRHAKC